jgi:ATP-binding cassette, subfamily B, bacterial
MLKRFIKYYLPHKRLLAAAMGAAVLSSLCSIMIPVLTRHLLQEYLPADEGQANIKGMSWVLAAMFALVFFSAALNYIRVRWGHVLGVRMEFDMREDIFRHIQKLSFTYFDKVKTGHIMSRISNDLNMIAEIAHHAPEDILISACMITGSFIVMFIFCWQLALVALVPLVCIVLWGIYYGGPMRQGFRKVRRKIADINSAVENSVMGIREVKAFANEDEEIDKFRQVNTSFRLAKERMYLIMANFFTVMNMMIESYFLVIVGAGAIMIGKGIINVADLVAFLLYVHFILKPLQRLVNFTEQLQQGSACFERFIEVMDIEPDIVDRPGAVCPENVKGYIKISDLNFRYEKSQDLVLRDINMDIPAGQSVAIVGESGAGKSTIVSLVPRFYEPLSGEITIDGYNIMELQQRFLREKIGLVQQSPFLFDTTVRENIMYSNPDADDGQLCEAAKKANIYDFVMSLPDGFDSMVGERGVMLSGGQKQRISISRVFLKDPPILIFDEATSSLDSESESLIQKSMELLSKGRTTIIIAHRLSTVKNVDKIYVMRHGRIIEQGSHDQLIENGGYYKSLYMMNIF